mmetsp:Transcript_19770/g.54989  ORF Transcript_19770/g.54989 Transcript_19770/m.54989 type:complete len:102 (-) Transcript_19770:1466-1771(-)
MRETERTRTRGIETELRLREIIHTKQSDHNQQRQPIASIKIAIQQRNQPIRTDHLCPHQHLKTSNGSLHKQIDEACRPSIDTPHRNLIDFCPPFCFFAHSS